MKLSYIVVITALLVGQALPASAAVVSVGERQAITSPGETFDFEFDGLPASDGTGGFLILVLNGDYSGRDTESAMISLDTAGGILDVGGNQADGVITNTIPGLTVKKFRSRVFSLNDQKRRWRFALSGSLLDSLLADDQIKINVQNDPDVGSGLMNNPDFIRVRLVYDTPAVIPVPPAFPLLLTALVAFAAVARRKQMVY